MAIATGHDLSSGKFGSITQWLEYLVYTEVVVGSSPTVPTKSDSGVELLDSGN